jgi:hypothetical protein
MEQKCADFAPSELSARRQERPGEDEKGGGHNAAERD